MKPHTVRTLVRNFVIASTFGLAVVASWAVTGLRNPPVDFGTADVCSLDGAATALLRHCTVVATRS